VNHQAIKLVGLTCNLRQLLHSDHGKSRKRKAEYNLKISKLPALLPVSHLDNCFGNLHRRHA